MKNLKECEQYKNKSGIYRIILLSDMRCYVGSTKDINRRIKSHYNDLSKNKHKNTYFQRTFIKYGEEKFMFEVLELCDANELLEREQFWIDKYESHSSDNGFNLAPVAGSTLGIKKTEQQIKNFQKAIQGKHDTKLTIEQASKVKELINNNLTLTEIARKFNTDYETIRSIRRGSTFRYVNPQIDYEESRKAKLTVEDVIEIKMQLNLGVTVKILSNIYEVSHRTISAIKNEINWKDIGEKITIKKRKSKSF